MQIEEVLSKENIKAFLHIHVTLNKHNPHFIQPLDKDIEDIFNPAKNKQFKYGNAKRWILKDNGKVIGRIAAFTTSKYINKGTNFATGGIGFFDCINNQQAANELFNTAKNWLISQGMEAMDGPINFGDRDKWWGLMVEGFDDEPVYGMPFNPNYYEQLFQQYGFKNYYNQYWYKMMVDDPLPPRFKERYEKFASKKDYSAKHADIKNLEKYAADFATVYNAAWAQHGEGKEITKEQVLKIFNTMKPIMDERMIWFAYYKEEPIAMFINIPDVNQYFKHFNGKLNFINKLRLLYMKATRQCKKLTGLAFGVVPKFQALGIDSFLIQSCANLVQNKGWYNTYEMGWAGDWNPRMVNIYKSLGGIQNRRMVTYRYIFDETKHNFERHPVMEYN
jgi:GNAT superfamily N-acetyltransferase